MAAIGHIQFKGKVMKYFIAFIMSFFMCFGAVAQNTSTLADIKIEVISNLQKDGYLSDKMAKEVAQKYISVQDKQTNITTNSSIISDTKVQVTSSTVNWTQYLSWVNAIKVVGVILLLLAFSGFIKMIVKNMWYLIAKVPVILYQTVFLTCTVFGTIFPEKVWASQYFYIALFCSFANIIVLGWIVTTYPKIQLVLAKLFNFGVPFQTVMSFWAMVYFGVLAISYQSSIFGFFAAVALSGILSFTMMYSPGVLFLHFRESALASLVFGHILVLAGYIAIYHSGFGMSYVQYFNAGIQYYCTIALGVGLLVGASPFYKTEKAFAYAFLFLIVFAFSFALYFFLGLPTIATILMIFFTLMFIEWFGYVGFKAGWVVGCATVGAMLYSTSLFLESYGAIIMMNMKAVIG